ncbi:ZIP family metal transporter [Mechercharimyces sp. CAU 1602]|uniref:ZIP family metal transporter n=1 Tax=Mechercharimyces sp. CAU 1602 TaxID=2973933 RepID=UPI0021621970|nr:ZIP family metal transporter [Mechercharimyces sp. CAU 1602]MCS1352309.1 hypothetical protein [Mechercharimyces sp. CAU 1602]
MSDAIIFSFLSGSATLVGAMIVIWKRSLSSRMISFALGMSASVMIMVSWLDLLPTAIRYGDIPHLALGVGGGLSLMMLLKQFHREDRFLQPNHQAELERLGLYLMIAVAAHNAPEGAAIGIGFGMEHAMGLHLAFAIAIHNVPEGIGLAAPLLAAGRSPLFIVLLTLITCGALPIGAWIGYKYLVAYPSVVAVGLMMAATTMIWVVSEVGPRSLRIDQLGGWLGLIFGIILMYFLHHLHGS